MSTSAMSAITSALKRENVKSLLPSILAFLIASSVSAILSSGTAFWLLLIASSGISAIEIIRYCIEDPKTIPHSATNFLRSSICASAITISLVQLFIQICRSSFGPATPLDWDRHADSNSDDGSELASTGALLGPLILVIVAFLMKLAVAGFVWMFPIADWIYLGKLRREEVSGEEGIELMSSRND